MAAPRSRWLLNSGMNLLGGASTALVSFCLPPILARQLPQMEYAVWNLVLPIVAYLGLFGSGLNLAIAKFISQANTPEGASDRDRTVRAGFALASIGALLALVAVTGFALFYPDFYPDVQDQLDAGFRTSVLWIGGAAALQLLALVPFGIFMGHQQNALYVVGQVITRACTLGGVWWLASHHATLSALSITYASTGLLLIPLVFGSLARTHPSYLRALFHFPDLVRVKELLTYCGSFSIWAVVGILVSSLDTMLVGRFDLLSVNPYAISLSLITVLSGLIHAVLSPLLPSISSLFATPEGRLQIPPILHRATFWASFGGQVVLIGFMTIGRPFLNLYAHLYGDAATPFLTILLIACVIRHIWLPYSIFLLSTSLHGKAFFSQSVEAITNLGFSIFLGYKLGAIGVAFGTLLGAIAGQIAVTFTTFRQTPDLIPSRQDFFVHAFIRPCLYLSPAYALLALWLTR